MSQLEMFAEHKLHGVSYRGIPKYKVFFPNNDYVLSSICSFLQDKQDFEVDPIADTLRYKHKDKLLGLGWTFYNPDRPKQYIPIHSPKAYKVTMPTSNSTWTEIFFD